MSRYFFNVIDGAALLDDVGSEHATLSGAKSEAVAYAGKLLCDDATTFWERGDWQMDVSDEAGLTLFTMIFAGYDAPASAVVSPC